MSLKEVKPQLAIHRATSLSGLTTFSIESTSKADCVDTCNVEAVQNGTTLPMEDWLVSKSTVVQVSAHVQLQMFSENTNKTCRPFLMFSADSIITPSRSYVTKDSRWRRAKRTTTNARKMPRAATVCVI